MTQDDKRQRSAHSTFLTAAKASVRMNSRTLNMFLYIHTISTYISAKCSVLMINTVVHYTQFLHMLAISLHWSLFTFNNPPSPGSSIIRCSFYIVCVCWMGELTHATNAYTNERRWLFICIYQCNPLLCSMLIWQCQISSVENWFRERIPRNSCVRNVRNGTNNASVVFLCRLPLNRCCCCRPRLCRTLRE